MNRQVKTWEAQLKTLVAGTSGKTGVQLTAHTHAIEGKRIQIGEKRRAVDMLFPNKIAQIIAHLQADFALFVKFNSVVANLEMPAPK